MSQRHDTEAPRGLGVITSVHGRETGKGFLFATMANQTEVFLHKSVFRPVDLYDAVQVGDRVGFALVEAPKGMRGHDCRRQTESEQERYAQECREHEAAIAERRGNSRRHGERMSHVDDYVEDRRRYPDPGKRHR